MKLFIPRLVLFVLLIINFSLSAQDIRSNLVSSPLYDYTKVKLNNKDTIPDYKSKQNKLKISGTIYKSDGLTPAKNVILYIEQADENGDFDLREQDNKRYVFHRACIKTDANGKYTLYTFIPGNDRRYNQLQQIFPIIKANSESNEYALESFLFDNDDLLSRLCRKRLAKKGDVSRILKPKLVNNILTVEKNIVLQDTNQDLK